MRVCCAAAVVALLVSAASPARADGLFYKLPKDGTWASYQFETSVKLTEDKEMKIKGTLRMASVGEATEGDQPCRWIEVTMEMTRPEIEGVKPGEETKERMKETTKVLIPEKFLAKGQTPLEHVIRAWAQSGQSKGKPRELKDANNIDEGPSPLILAGPLKDPQQLDKVEIESKLGKLMCAGESGTVEFKMKRGGTMKGTLESRLHPDAPFGVVASKWTLQIQEEKSPAMTMVWDFKLADFGEKAKSELRDAK